MSPLSAGSSLGRYRILRPLGVGAMGEVYLAEDPQIERQLAIKTVRVEEGKPAEVEERKRRLLREAKAAGRLMHPHIVTLFDAGADQELLFLAFEYIEGSDLAQRLEEGAPLTLGEVLRLVRQACEALDYAHRQGIVHRDIKPSNLLLGREGQLKISDFGIAKVLGQSTELTMTGSVVGSPHYLSPEQIRGEELDGRSDIFSLGVVLYELLCRQRPFAGDTLTTLVYQILHQEPTSLVVRRPDLPPRVEQVARRMLAKDRAQRFANAGEAAGELAALERELPPAVLTRPAAPEPLVTDRTTRLGDVTPPPLPIAAAPTTSTAAPVPRRKLPLAMILGGVAGVIALLVAAAIFLPPLLKKRSAEEVPADVPAAVATPAEELTGGGRSPLTASQQAAAGRERVQAGVSPEQGTRTAGSGASRQPVPTGAGGVTGATSSMSPARSVEPPASAAAGGEAPVPSARPSQLPAPARSAPAAEPQLPPSQPTVESEPEPVASDLPAVAVDREIQSGMGLSFEVNPKDAIVKIDRTVVGRADEWNARKKEGRPYTLPDPGEHLVKITKEGMRDYLIRVEASRDGPAVTTVGVALQSASGGGGRSGPQRLRVGEGLVLRVEPDSAKVAVDGREVGVAREFGGGLGRRRFLDLEAGVHKITFSAPGYREAELEVEVVSGAPEKRPTARVRLVRAP